LKGIPYSIALAHTMFNLIAALLVLPFTKQFARLIEKIIPVHEDEEKLSRVALNEELLETPAIAITQIRKEICDMLRVSKKAVEKASLAFKNRNTREARKIAGLEDITDEYQTEITRYLVALSRQEIPADIAGIQPVFLHSVNDIERIADHAMNITEITQRRLDNNHDLGTNTDQEISRIIAEVLKMYQYVLDAFENGDREKAVLALEVEGVVNELDRTFRDNHVQRMSDNICSALSGLVYIDFLQNMEKIGDHLANVAQGIISGSEWPEHMHSHEDAEQVGAI